MKRRYRAPILWAGLGAVVVLAYVLSQPVPIPIDGYRPPETQTAAGADAAADAAAPAGADVAAPATVEVPAAPAATEPPAAPAAQPQAVATLPPPVPAAATTGTPVETLYVSATSLNLRAAPAAGAPVLELLPRGTPVNAVGAVEGWREVINPATGTRGWMSAEYLAATPPAAAAAAPAPATPGLTPEGGGATAPALVLLP